MTPHTPHDEDAHTYTHTHTTTTSLPTMAERVRLNETTEERERNEELADLFCIIVAIEKIEKAYMRSNISAQAYEEQCRVLLSKYKLAYGVVKKVVGTVEGFLADYSCSYPTAVARITKGVPLTEEGVSGSQRGQTILAAGEHMTTCVDALKMGQVSADALHPIITDIVTTVSQLYPNLPELLPIQDWLRKINAMKAADELDDDQRRQLSHDVERTYGAFSRELKNTS